MDAVLPLLALAVIVAAVVWVARRGTRPDQAPPASDAVQPPAATIPLPSFAEAAESLSAFYDQTAHPQELEANEALMAIAGRMADAQCPLDTVVNYCTGANGVLAGAAAIALARREDAFAAVGRVIAALPHARVWTDYYILRFLDARAREPVLGRVLLEAPEWWADNAVMPQVLSDFADARVAAGEPPDLAPALDARPDAAGATLDKVLGKLTTSHLPALRQSIATWRSARIDREYLASVGRLWAEETDASPILPCAVLDAAVPVVVEAVRKPRPASLLIVGEAGVGKSVVVRAVARELAAAGWTLFEASAIDVIAGQSYIGELEGRIRQLVAQLNVGRRVVWYVPAFHELFYAGRHRYSPSGVLDLLLPAIESGELCVIGETQPAALERILQQRPRLRIAFKSLNLDALPPDEAAVLGDRWVEQEAVSSGLEVEPGLIAEAIEIASHYLTTRVLPGSLFDLLRATHARLRARGQSRATRDALFETLSEITGLPRRVVDDREGLDPAALREHFAARIMGQPVAVRCLVDRIAMLKAGLSDPNRPIGVFLFAGPTGTGKTEVAKCLAEFLFGSADRLLRLDMSELQDASSLDRVLGTGGDSGETQALVNRIRKQPFSVVLLDEFEKAHPRVWDLFLQVFDDGRLSDVQGNPADFRHSIIILTSNVGATEHRGSSLGFLDGGGTYTEGQVLRAIGSTFRPELVNRIDRVVVFQPLSRAVMREILKKELRLVLGRRGFRSREWAVEWESSAIEFLLDRGFTPDMGARPLRRAIEEHVLAPIALTIVEHRFPQGDQFLFVKSDSRAIQVEFVDPDAPCGGTVEGGTEPPALVAEGAAVAAAILAPRGSPQEHATLRMALDGLVDTTQGQPWREGKTRHMRALNATGFWESEDRFRVLDRVERMDRVESGIEAAVSLMRRLEHRDGRRRDPISVVADAAQMVYLLQTEIASLLADDAADVFLRVEPVGGETEGVTTAWAARVVRMYESWGAKRRMRVEPLRDPGGRLDVLALGGFGVWRLLGAERGLHVLETPDAHGGFDRLSVRVQVVPQPVVPRAQQASPHQHALACLRGVEGAANTVVRRYRERPSPLVRDAAGWRTGRIEHVLGGDFDLYAAGAISGREAEAGG